MEIGRHTVTILTNEITTIGDKSCVRLLAEFPDGDAGDVVIWLTPNSMGIARRSLKLCGFDPDAEEFAVLVDNPDRFKGKKIDVVVEEFNGRLRAQIALGGVPPERKEILAIQTALRAAKKGKEASPPNLDKVPF